MNWSQATFARFNSLTWLYVEIAQLSFIEYIQDIEECSKLSEHDRRFGAFQQDICKYISGVKTIVFSAMALEAAVYEFAAIRLGDEYVRRYLDRLDMFAKWVIVLRLVCRYEIDEDREPFDGLKKLISARNRLMHSKSEPVMHDRLEEQLTRLKDREVRHDHDVKNAFKALVRISQYLELNLKLQGYPLPSFNPDNPRFKSSPSGLRDLIRESWNTTKVSKTSP